ncbi:hypothetical protein HYN48_01425 [Flavobacterium magnum]|uniref:Outer membrane protein beta-barrel domain-containing protein n=1 Tax=Flavobacterium magnum TaxID=2162713 RepID=A0A2S0RBC2_9FLAO|nr:hypothetical protein [Flavobacterium magnum]AWA28855.1 hypothetical protein HYN48_01425 [Flavobacterium magnum]
MRNLTIYLAGFLCLFFSRMSAQQTFEDKAKSIAAKIENITKEEKMMLRDEVELVNQDLEKGTITAAQADERKLKLAEVRARNIETRVAAAESELKALVQDKVDGKIAERDTANNGYRVDLYFPGFKIRDSRKPYVPGELRTTSQFVFAFGVNNLATDGAIAGSDYRYWGSHFYEWGLSWNTRIAKNSNLLHAKYGLSLMYNNLRPTDNRMFVDNGSQTDLETNPVKMEDSRFRNVNLVVPLHLEFDFTRPTVKDGKTLYKTHESFRLGLGGYAGVNLKSKQIIKYDIAGYDSKEVTKGSFNVNDFIYGLSAYVGYGEVSLYAKYDLNPLFKDNAVKQNNVSLGVRFDLN